jgi:hypothetical protein
MDTAITATAAHAAAPRRIPLFFFFVFFLCSFIVFSPSALIIEKAASAFS